MTTGKAWERIRRALAGKPPAADEIVLLECGGNDFRWAEVAADPRGAHLPKTPIDRFGSLLQSIIDLFKSVNVKPILMALPLEVPRRRTAIRARFHSPNSMKRRTSISASWPGPAGARLAQSIASSIDFAWIIQ